jgi:hypothetical protein
MSQKWTMVYGGRSDGHSALGYAAASWSTFDRRVWTRALPDGRPLRLTLKNLRNAGFRAPRKIATYLVLLESGGEVLAVALGYDHGALVRKMKEFVAAKLG